MLPKKYRCDLLQNRGNLALAPPVPTCVCSCKYIVIKCIAIFVCAPYQTSNDPTSAAIDTNLSSLIIYQTSVNLLEFSVLKEKRNSIGVIVIVISIQFGIWHIVAWIYRYHSNVSFWMARKNWFMNCGNFLYIFKIITTNCSVPVEINNNSDQCDFLDSDLINVEYSRDYHKDEMGGTSV